MSREWPVISGITVACLNKVGNLPSENERLAKWAMISQKSGYFVSGTDMYHHATFHADRRQRRREKNRKKQQT